MSINNNNGPNSHVFTHDYGTSKDSLRSSKEERSKSLEYKIHLTKLDIQGRQATVDRMVYEIDSLLTEACQQAEPELDEGKITTPVRKRKVTFDTENIPLAPNKKRYLNTDYTSKDSLRSDKVSSFSQLEPAKRGSIPFPNTLFYSKDSLRSSPEPERVLSTCGENGGITIDGYMCRSTFLKENGRCHHHR